MSHVKYVGFANAREVSPADLAKMEVELDGPVTFDRGEAVEVADNVAEALTHAGGLFSGEFEVTEAPAEDGTEVKPDLDDMNGESLRAELQKRQADGRLTDVALKTKVGDLRDLLKADDAAQAENPTDGVEVDPGSPAAETAPNEGQSNNLDSSGGATASGTANSDTAGRSETGSRSESGSS